MKHNKHTSGPWIIQTASSDGEIIEIRNTVKAKNSALQIKIETINAGPTNWKNARLIAAAPELLEALEAVLLQSKMPTLSEDELIQLIENAIAKARGEL